jgi:hypothetical protein
LATVSFLFLLFLLLTHIPRPATGLLSHITHYVSDWIIIQGIRGRNKGLKKLKKQKQIIISMKIEQLSVLIRK